MRIVTPAAPCPSWTRGRSPLPDPDIAGPVPLLLLVLLALFAATVRPVAAQAHFAALEDGGSTWVAIDHVEHGDIYLDTASIVALGEDVFQVRTRWQFARVQTDGDGEPYRTSVALRAVDCRAGEMALLAYADRDGARTVDSVQRPLYAATWEAVNPRSPAARIAERTCAIGHRADTRLAAGGAPD